ncbi:MAG: cation:proton antiporter [Candidatus Wallbacteria bacterium]|nr:cation:proton antiporter [Candidatus Wallbacteria bacterium]
MESHLIEKVTLLAFQLSVIIVSAKACGVLFEKMRFPSVLGELVAGIIIGPYLLGTVILPGFPEGLFPMAGDFPVSTELYGIATIASILLLFSAGLETDIDTFLSYSVVGSVVGIIGVLFSFIFGDLAGVYLSRWFMDADFGFMHPVPLFLGVISTATSVGISARILSEKKKMDSPVGITILSAAVIDDILGIIVLSIVIGTARGGGVSWSGVAMITAKAVGIWLLVTAAGLLSSRRMGDMLKKLGDNPSMALMSFAMALLLAGFFEKAGMAMIIGAYIMGLSLAKTDVALIIREHLEMLSKLLIPVFFCVMGMLVNLKEIFGEKALIFGTLYAIVCFASKLIGCSLPALCFDFTLRGAMTIGVGMIPRGEVALIVAGVGLSSGLIPHDIFSIAIMMTFVTTMVTPQLLAVMLGSDKPMLKKEHKRAGNVQESRYWMPNEETAELVLSKLLLSCEQEGFFMHRMDIPSPVYNLRKNEIFVTVRLNGLELEIDGPENFAAYIHTMFYEVIAELEHTMKRLQSMAGKENVGRQIFQDSSLVNNGNHVPSSKSKNRISAASVDLIAGNKHQAIEEMLDLLITAGHLNRELREKAMIDIIERETAMSTGMQEGIAMPHARTCAVDHIVTAVGLKREGIDFGSLDRKPAKIIILTLAPKSMSQPYLQHMAEMASRVKDDKGRSAVLSSTTPEELINRFAN